MKADFAPIFELGLSEKLQLLEDLWDDIATQSANVPVSTVLKILKNGVSG